MAKKQRYVSPLLVGIAIGKTYKETEVRKAFCNSTGILDEGHFQDFLIRNSNSILTIKTPFADFITFTDVISAKGVEGENAKHFVRSTETPKDPVREAHLPKKQSLFDKYKIHKN